jgi:hypothetical protein
MARQVLVGAVVFHDNNRFSAAAIFGTAVLMYGKEPTLREVWRWAREA